jgi:hypothetical protein
MNIAKNVTKTISVFLAKAKTEIQTITACVLTDFLNILNITIAFHASLSVKPAWMEPLAGRVLLDSTEPFQIISVFASLDSTLTRENLNVLNVPIIVEVVSTSMFAKPVTKTEILIQDSVPAKNSFLTKENFPHALSAAISKF